MMSLAMLSLVACEDEYQIPSKFCDVSWYSSSTADGVYYLAENNYFSFMDLSQGALSHKWIVTADSVDGEFAFLKNGIPPKPENIEDYIDPSISSTTSKKTVHVLFKKAGTYKVRLFNTYSSEVTYRGSDTLKSVYKDGAYVIDTAFTVRAFGELIPEYAVYKDAEHTIPVETGVDENGDTLTYELEASSKLYFVDMTKFDQPTSRNWISNKAQISNATDSAAVMTFNSLGEVQVTLKSIREGNNYPSAQVSEVVPLKINVVKSSIPFEIEKATELKNETIHLAFNGEINSESVAGKESHFSVHVTNEAAGYDQVIPVSAISVDSNNKTILALKLAGKIYATDVVRISYNPNGEPIQSVDFRDMSLFENKEVSMYINELCAGSDFKFDSPNINSIWVADWDNGYDFGFVEDPSLEADPTRKGKSMKIDMSKQVVEGKGAFKMTCKSAISTMKANTDYIFSYKVFIPFETETHKAWNVRIMVPGNWSDVKQCWANLADVTKGEWVTKSQVLNFKEDKAGRSFNLQMAAAEVSGVVYVDDFSIIEAEVRP